MNDLLAHLRSHVIAYLALFLALGGAAAYAAAEIGSSDIKRNAVKSRHIGKGQVKRADIQAKAQAVWAVVDADPTDPAIVRDRGATNLVRISEGTYDVGFSRPVGACAFSATLRGGNSHIAAITTALNPPAGITGKEIRIDVTGSSGDPVDRDFSVVAFC